jgi:hypothetical protein
MTTDLPSVRVHGLKSNEQDFLPLHFLLDEGISVPKGVGADDCTFFGCHTCLIFLCGCFLGCLLLSCWFMLNPLNGHLIVCPWIWKQACPDPTCNTTFVVLRKGLPRRRGTSLLWPMSRVTKSMGMYVSQILTKMSLATPRFSWSLICHLQSKICSGQWSTQNLIIYYLGHEIDACSKVAEGVVEDMWTYWTCDCRASRILLGDERWIHKLSLFFLT